MPIGRQASKRKGRDRDPERPTDSSQGKGDDRDPKRPNDSTHGKGKDADLEMPIDSSQGKGFDDGQDTKMEQVTESSDESSDDDEYCDICGFFHSPPFCNYEIYLPPGKEPVNTQEYAVVCDCGCAVLENGKGEFTCGCCFFGAPKRVILKSDVLPPQRYGPLPADSFPEEFLRRIERHDKLMEARCRETKDISLHYSDTDTESIE